MSARLILLTAALVMLSGVAIGAFGAHGLGKALERLGRTDNLEKRAEWLETGVRYQLYHGLALLGLACFTIQNSQRQVGFAAIAFLIGVVLFSGSLYAMTLGPEAWRKLGMITPIGGLAFLVGWGRVAYYAWTKIEA